MNDEAAIPNNPDIEKIDAQRRALICVGYKLPPCFSGLKWLTPLTRKQILATLQEIVKTYPELITEILEFIYQDVNQRFVVNEGDLSRLEEALSSSSHPEIKKVLAKFYDKFAAQHLAEDLPPSIRPSADTCVHRALIYRRKAMNLNFNLYAASYYRTLALAIKPQIPEAPSFLTNRVIQILEKRYLECDLLRQIVETVGTLQKFLEGCLSEKRNQRLSPAIMVSRVVFSLPTILALLS
jgi:hypothetical protein